MRARHGVLGVGLAMVLLTAPIAAAASYPPPSDNNGTVTPSRIQAGECAVFSGGGFEPLSAVAVTDNNESRGTAQTDEQGSFAKELCYDVTTPAGQHHLKGTGDKAGNGGRRTVTAELFVEGVSQSSSPGNHGSGKNVAFTGATGLGAALLALLFVGVGSLTLVVTELRHRRRRRLA